MRYINKHLYIEKIRVDRIAKKYGTPIYCYSLDALRKNIQDFKKNFKSFSPLICFSVKSNFNIQILKEIKKMGIGADVVSKGELMAALKAGIAPNKIVFSGIGKTFDEIKYAVENNILLINAESESEVREIEKISRIKKKVTNIGLRLNPNIDAKTLKEISTGKYEDKFGITELILLKILKKFRNSKYLNISCLSVHIGSQITDYRPYIKMVNVLSKLIKKSKHKFDYVDLGGGMGIKYEHKTKKLNYKKYEKKIQKFLKENKVKIIFEPGRSIIADTAILLTKIIYIKETKKKNFIILDSGMNDLIRPAIYGSKHQIIPFKKNNIIVNKLHDLVGPICESTDKFLSLNKYQKVKEKDLLAICDVGAYGAVLASNYNLRTKPAEILINKSLYKIISKRQKLNNII